MASECESDVKTELEDSLDAELECIVDDIKLLRLRLITTRSYIDLLQQQINEATELEQELNERLKRQLKNELKIRKKISSCPRLADPSHGDESLSSGPSGVDLLLDGDNAEREQDQLSPVDSSQGQESVDVHPSKSMKSKKTFKGRYSVAAAHLVKSASTAAASRRSLSMHLGGVGVVEVRNKGSTSEETVIVCQTTDLTAEERKDDNNVSCSNIDFQQEDEADISRNLSHVIQPVIVDTTSKPMFQCLSCGKSFTFKSNFTRHLRVACNKRSSMPASLNPTTSNDTEKVLLSKKSVSVCHTTDMAAEGYTNNDKGTSTGSSVRQVNETTSVNKSVTGSEVTNLSAVAKPISVDQTSLKPIYLCFSCGTSFTYKCNLRRHMREACNGSQSTPPIKQSALLEHKNDTETPTETFELHKRVYKCPVCRLFCSTTQGAITRHLKSKICQGKQPAASDTEDSIQCFVDDASIKIALDSAMRMGDGAGENSEPQQQDLYQCPTCHLYYKNKGSLASHLRKSGCDRGQDTVAGVIDQATIVDDASGKRVSSRDMKIDSAGENCEPRQQDCLYQCPKCHLYYKNKVSLASHMKKSGCDKGQNALPGMMDQARVYSATKSLILSATNYITEEPSVYSVVEPVEHPVRVHTIKESGNCYTNASQVKRRSYFNVISQTCFICGDSNVTDWSENYIDGLSRICQQCENRFSDSGQWFNLENSSSGQPLKRFGCLMCNKKTSNNLKSLWLHIRQHTNYKPFMCNICGKSFPEQGTLRNHLRLHDMHKTWPLQCEICEKVFRSESSLETHMMLHTGRKSYSPSYMCNVCGKSYALASSLRSHMFVHEPDKKMPYHCDVCSKQYLCKSGLILHKLRHTGEKPHTCPICGRAFREKFSVKIHMRYHTGERPYVCTICPKTFVMSCHLKKHMCSHFDEKTDQCPICSKYFKANGALRKHKKTHFK